LQTREAEGAKRESLAVQEAKEIQSARVRNEELLKRLDDEKRKLHHLENESKALTSKREEEIDAREKMLRVKEENVSKDYRLL
jgi:hypothetical protein